MEQDLTKDQIRKRIKKEWNIQNIEELEARGDIIITNSREWYYPDGKLYAERIKGKWRKAVNAALDNGRKGLRAFAATDGFFADGFAQGLVDYEATLGTGFEIPFIAICSYKVSDIANRMTAEQLSSLHSSHGLHRSFGYNILENPS